VNLGDAVLTGIVGWLLAKVFKPDGGASPKETTPAPSSSSAPSTTPRVPQGATAPSPTAAPWPRGETSVPAPKTTAYAQPLEPRAPIEHVLVPWGQPYGKSTRPEPFKKTGRAVPQTEQAAVVARERKPFERAYWRPKRKLTPAVVARARALLPEWTPGGVTFDGPRSFAGRVQFRMTKHGGKKAVEAWEPAPPFV